MAQRLQEPPPHNPNIAVVNTHQRFEVFTYGIGGKEAEEHLKRQRRPSGYASNHVMSFKFDFSLSTLTSEDGQHTTLSPSTEDADDDTQAANALVASYTRKTAQKECATVDARLDVDLDTFDTIDLAQGMGLNFTTSCHIRGPEYLKSHDVVPGIYEGGLKIWECSTDMCRYLARYLASVLGEDRELGSSIESDHLKTALSRAIGSGGSALELGCGYGLPGCLILREGMKHHEGEQLPPTVIFSDFNDFVLKTATIPNAYLNLSSLPRYSGTKEEEEIQLRTMLDRAMFVGGDWLGLSGKLTNKTLQTSRLDFDGRFDVILASETTYTSDSCKETAFLMLAHLKIECGVGLIATKRFYFGVGGGSDSFESAAKLLSSSSAGPFAGLELEVKLLQQYDTGTANIRDMMQVRCLRK